MGNYNPLNILKQSPETLKTLFLAIAAGLVVSGVITPSGDEVAIWGLALERFLQAMYVYPVQKANLVQELDALTNPAPPMGGE